MKTFNYLPIFLDCMKRWEARPSERDFLDSYWKPISEKVGIVFDDDGPYFYSVLEDVNWEPYRAEVLTLDAEREERRFIHHVRQVEDLFGFELEGEAVLFGAFTCMDGYARFDRGTHRVFLGVDESHGRGAYLDVLETHELTHVARESRAPVWEGFGLDPKMTHDDFVEVQPVIEHLTGEGFSCVVSELLVPGEGKWSYAYQTEDSLALILQKGPAVDRGVKNEIRRGHEKGDYSKLYNPSRYGLEVSYAHYVWAWQWAKKALQDLAGGDPRKFVSMCSKDFVEHALEFELREIR